MSKAISIYMTTYLRLKPAKTRRSRFIFDNYRRKMAGTSVIASPAQLIPDVDVQGFDGLALLAASLAFDLYAQRKKPP
jgi:hypothetical protein